MIGASRSMSLSCFGRASWMSLSAGSRLGCAADDRARRALVRLAQLDLAQQDRIGVFVELGELAFVVGRESRSAISFSTSSGLNFQLPPSR